MTILREGGGWGGVSISSTLPPRERRELALSEDKTGEASKVIHYLKSGEIGEEKGRGPKLCIL